MKAADLMIGDWVVKPSGHIRTMGRAEFSNDDAWFEDSKPIPLTAEILEGMVAEYSLRIFCAYAIDGLHNGRVGLCVVI